MAEQQEERAAAGGHPNQDCSPFTNERVAQGGGEWTTPPVSLNDRQHWATKARAIVDARHVFMWLLRQQGRSYPEIGAELGMDHTSAINGVKRVDGDPLLRDAAAAVHQKLTGEMAAA